MQPNLPAMEGQDFGTAGASARREYERRKARREERMRNAHPRAGGLLLKFQDAPQSEQAWTTGATGEEQLAASLARRCPSVLILHDRHLPGKRANIDHLAIAASGVYVIDAKRYKGKIEVRKPFRGQPKLFISGRDKSKLIEGMARQVETVKGRLKLIEKEVPVHGCFCFINPAGQPGGSGLPLFRSVTVGDFALLYPRRLAKRLNQSGPLGEEARLVIAEALAELLPSA